MNQLKKKIGIVGGGQLGKMIILDAKRLGFYVITLDPEKLCPSHSLSDEHIVAAFDDEKALRELAQKVDVITYEFEHINVDILTQLEDEGHLIYPTPSSLRIIQNKFRQKAALQRAGFLVPDFQKIATPIDIEIAGENYKYPLMLKTCTGGYDGKGNTVIKKKSEIKKAYTQLGSGEIHLMVEPFIQFEKEISVLACQGIDGQVVIYPVGENSHVNSILDETVVPATLSNKCETEAKKLAKEVMELFAGVGMFCVEMFVTADEVLYINEVAPRPHNSGHYTIEGCVTSQFENHIRAIVGLPLGDTSLRAPSVMKNLLGEPEAQGEAQLIGLEEAYKDGAIKVHLYGKHQVRPYRKMGHITGVGNDLSAVKQAVNQAYNQIKIIGGRKI